ncbi:MAG: hypothetical protein M0R37_10580 [Bacteroidales bacterium]|nr:hypothetical protein [Bacteroidales bacterium]
MKLGVNVERAEPLDVMGPLTDAQLRAADVAVTLDSESVAVTGPLTDTELRATAVPVSGPLTDTELRAADVAVTLDSESVAVTGPLTDTELRAAAVAVSGPLTDTELRAADVAVTLDSESVAVTGPLTDTELRATAVPVSDAGAAWVSSRQTTTSADMTGAADLTPAPESGDKIVVDDVILSADTAMYVDFIEETSDTLIFRLFVPAGGTAQFSPRAKLQLPTADKKLRGDASASGNVAILVLYHSEA